MTTPTIQLSLWSELDEAKDAVRWFDPGDYVGDEQYQDWLDDLHPDDVEICGITYRASYALQQVDPIAYRCGFSDWTANLDPDNFPEYEELTDEVDRLTELTDQLDDLYDWVQMQDTYDAWAVIMSAMFTTAEYLHFDRELHYSWDVCDLSKIKALWQYSPGAGQTAPNPDDDETADELLATLRGLDDEVLQEWCAMLTICHQWAEDTGVSY